MIYKVNLNWTASINKIVEIEARTKEEALENALNRSVDHALFNEDRDPAAFSWENPDSIEYFLEEEACFVFD